MTILNISNRTFEIFDPRNRKHREAAFEFKQRRSWSRSKIRFDIDDNSTNLVDLIDRRLNYWYLTKEFNKPLRKKA